MTDAKKIVEFDGLDPAKPFYMAAAVDMADGSMDPAQMAEGFFIDVDEATRALAEYADDHNGNGYVYLCTPVKRVRRGRVQITDVKKPHPAPSQ